MTAVRFSHAKCQDMNRRIALLPSFAFGTGSTSLSLSLSNQKGVDMKRDSSKNHGIKCLAHIFKQRSIYIFIFIYLFIYLLFI